MKYILVNNEEKISLDKLFAYTLAKIKPFKQARRSSYLETDLYNDPPAFVWRFCDNPVLIYERLKRCVISFSGNLKWTMYKFTLNYTIEPLKIYELRESEGINNLYAVLKFHHKDLPYKAIEDIKPLCDHIEEEFSLKDKKPLVRK